MHVWRKVPKLSSGNHRAWFPKMLHIFTVPRVDRRGYKILSRLEITSSGFPDRNELQLPHADDLGSITGPAHTPHSWRDQLVQCLTIPPNPDHVLEETWDTNAIPSEGGLRQWSAVTAVTALVNTPESKPQLKKWSKPQLPSIVKTGISVNIKTFVYVLKNRCHIQNMSIFVCFSKCWQNKLLKNLMDTLKNLHTFNINVSSDKFNLQSSSSESKF